ncbi:histidine phosphatase family protein [Massilia sp. IC2-477]|uniref:SixA phosphatase family protein n=1 Tax=unclassified Massilia TaxID=2609279 RepID=UPI001D10344A|nr:MULTISPECIES: histidine phosphatase family protein [unclassified Massilia]MCC2957366.1 histidine phosphatase family protein [Massilia sp. IC2-477]MCC2973940.1 histidine phosphatase family protein [Massilia sp. IC2-476]
MDLILWRHAEAEPHVEEGDVAGDLRRALTPKGKRHAARVGAWLHRQLPDDVRVLCSPAKRCVQTVEALGRNYKLLDALAPDSNAEAILDAASWPEHRQPALIVGHQPLLGHVASLVLCGGKQDWRIRKAGVFWITRKGSDGLPYVKLVVGPDFIGQLR